MRFSAAGISKIKTIAFSGDIFFHAVDSVGKRGYITTAGKFNPKGTPIYFGMLKAEDSIRAAFDHAGKHGVSLYGYALHRTPYLIRVNLHKVVDLRNKDDQEKVGLTAEEILSLDRDKTQAVGRHAIASKVQGILFPSYAGDCLVVFKDVVDLLKKPEEPIKILPVNHISFIDYIRKFLSEKT